MQLCHDGGSTRNRKLALDQKAGHGGRRRQKDESTREVEGVYSKLTRLGCIRLVGACSFPLDTTRSSLPQTREGTTQPD